MKKYALFLTTLTFFSIFNKPCQAPLSLSQKAMHCAIPSHFNKAPFTDCSIIENTGLCFLQHTLSELYQEWAQIILKSKLRNLTITQAREEIDQAYRNIDNSDMRTNFLAIGYQGLAKQLLALIASITVAASFKVLFTATENFMLSKVGAIITANGTGMAYQLYEHKYRTTEKAQNALVAAPGKIRNHKLTQDAVLCFYSQLPLAAREKLFEYFLTDMEKFLGYLSHSHGDANDAEVFDSIMTEDHRNNIRAIIVSRIATLDTSPVIRQFLE
jgi:hypothetical protein